MTNLPVEQISEGQRRAPQLHVEPDAKVMQSDFRSQSCLKAVQRMRTLTSQPKDIEQLVVGRFNDLTQPSQPAPPVFGPAHFAPLVRRADHLGIVVLVPEAMQLIARKALIGHIDALGGRAHTGQARGRSVSHGQEGLRQRVVVATARSKAETSNHAGWGNGGEQMKAFIPPNAIAPADIGLPCQPASATPLRVSRRNARTVQGFIQAVLCLHLLNQVQTEGHDDSTILPLQPIELLAFWQGRKRWSQVAHRIAVEGAFARELRPLAKHGQCHHLATRQRGGWPRTMFLIIALRLAKIIDHHVQCSQKGILVHQQRAPFPCESVRQAHCRVQDTLLSSPFYFTPNVQVDPLTPQKSVEGDSVSEQGFNPFKSSLSRTRQLFSRVGDAFRQPDITDDFWDELEETLISADVGPSTSAWLIERLHKRVAEARMHNTVQVQRALREELVALLGKTSSLRFAKQSILTVILVIGVNGSGKTTSIAKLAHRLTREGHKVILAAADTFRAAAIDQLRVWGN